MRAGAAAVGADVGGAAGLFEQIGQERHRGEVARLVNRAGQRRRVRSLPGGVGGEGAEWVTDDATEEVAEYLLSTGLGSAGSGSRNGPRPPHPACQGGAGSGPNRPGGFSGSASR